MSDDVAAIRAARERTIAAGSARVSRVTDSSWTWPAFPAKGNRHPAWGPILGAGRFAWSLVGRPVWRAATRGVDVRHMTAEGIIDFTGRRFMIDYGSYAILQVGSQEWDGRSGRALSTLPASAARVGSPLWLVDLVGGTTGAENLGVDHVQGREWRRYLATASLAEASADVPAGMASPGHDRFEDLLRLEVEVWLDAVYLRQVRFIVDRDRVETVTLRDFGTPVEGLDWDRLPTFRSPDDSARSAST